MSCIVTNDKEYLGKDNIDKFDALIFKIRFFKSDDKGKQSTNDLIQHQQFLENGNPFHGRFAHKILGCKTTDEYLNNTENYSVSKPEQSLQVFSVL